MTTHNSPAAQRELVITRIFDAPRELVWKAWTEAEMFKKWWGPEHFTSPEAKMDFRVGGKYLSCMQGPDGKRYWSTGTYKEIVPMARIVYTDSFADEHGHAVPATDYGMEGLPMERQVTVTFEDQDGKTKMTLHDTGLPEGQVREMAQAGWNQSFDKMVEVVRRERRR